MESYGSATTLSSNPNTLPTPTVLFKLTKPPSVQPGAWKVRSRDCAFFATSILSKTIERLGKLRHLFQMYPAPLSSMLMRMRPGVFSITTTLTVSCLTEVPPRGEPCTCPIPLDVSIWVFLWNLSIANRIILIHTIISYRLFRINSPAPRGGVL